MKNVLRGLILRALGRDRKKECLINRVPQRDCAANAATQVRSYDLIVEDCVVWARKVTDDGQEHRYSTVRKGHRCRAIEEHDGRGGIINRTENAQIPVRNVAMVNHPTHSFNFSARP